MPKLRLKYIKEFKNEEEENLEKVSQKKENLFFKMSLRLKSVSLFLLYIKLKKKIWYIYMKRN